MAGDCPCERNRHSPSLESQAILDWHTPDCSDRRSKASRQQGLSNQVVDWPNVPAQEPARTSKGNGRGLAESVQGKKRSVGLRGQANPNTNGRHPGLLPPKPSNWSTPIAGDWKGQKKADGTEQMLCAQVTKFQAKGQLNPRWVESLMGLPLGWTQPSALIRE